MAQSPSHTLGQFIGDRLENAIRIPLQLIADNFGLYLDYKHQRYARGRRSIVSWTDSYGNEHDLDYVLEEGGNESKLGRPIAFIETAWRRYTKHSKNKAQEIQGALVPLADTYASVNPFLGVVLAGDFTDASLAQLKTHRFNVAYCPYSNIVAAFRTENVDISWEEDTSTRDLERKVETLQGLSKLQCTRINNQILNLNAEQFDPFFNSLRASLSRRIVFISILSLSGTQFEFNSVSDAVKFISSHDRSQSVKRFVRYELTVRYSNEDVIRGCFQEKSQAIEFLQKLTG